MIKNKSFIFAKDKINITKYIKNIKIVKYECKNKNNIKNI